MFDDQRPEQASLREAFLEIEKLKSENDRLRGALDSGRRIQGIQPAEELDYRFLTGFRQFIERGVLVETVADLCSLACESVLVSLDCGVGIMIYVEAGDPQPLLLHSGLGVLSDEALPQMRAWTEQCWKTANQAEARESFFLPPLPMVPPIQGGFLVEPVLNESGGGQGLLIAWKILGTEEPDFSETVKIGFRIFAKQLELLMVNLNQHLTIIEQVETLRISEDRLSVALALNHVGLWDWDLVTGHIYYSDHWKRQLGLESEMLSGAPDEWIDRIHPDDWDHAVAVVHDCCMTLDGSFELTLRMRKKDGSWIWINSRGHHAATKDGVVRRMIGIQTDITEPKIVEGGRLGRENELDQARLDRPVEIGGRSARRLLRLIGESSDVVGNHSGDLVLKPQVVDLKMLCEDLKTIESGRAPQSGVDLRWEVTPDVPQRVLVDRLRLRQVLSNLMVSALDFNGHGSVSLEVRTEKPSENGEAVLSFEVSGSGCGLAHEPIQPGFTPSSDKFESNLLQERGMGLRLAITEELIARMGGKLRFSSRVGKGAVMTLRLSVRDMTEEISGEDSPAILETLAFQGKILVVDDDPVSAEIGRMMLRTLGFQVDLANDGRQALALASSVAYDLILMDRWMPVMGGVEATRCLRASSSALSRHVPIFALTANAGEADVAECRAAGMQEVIIKPLNMNDLVEKLRLHLGFDPHHTGK